MLRYPIIIEQEIHLILLLREGKSFASGKARMVQEEMIQQAKEFHRQGDLAAAEELYRQVLAGNSDDPDANHLLGVIHYQRGEYDTSLELIQKAVVIRPDHAATYNNLGSVQKSLGMSNEALDSFTKAIELQSDYAEAWNNLGTVYKKIGQLDEAEKAYMESIRFKPGYVKALNNLGNLCKKRGDFIDSLNWFGKALEIDPDLPLSHYNLGCALVPLGRLDEAEAALLQSLKGDPEMVEAMTALGRLYCLRFQFALSLDFLERALTLQPDSEEVHLSLANTYSSMGRFVEAVYFLERVVAISPDSAEVHNSLGLAYNFLDKMDEAMQCLEKAIQLCPDNPEVLCSMATIYIARGLFEESSAVCRKAIGLEPSCARAYFQLAQVCNGNEAADLVAAMTDLLSSESIGPMQEMQLQFGLAKLLEDRGEYSKAFQHLWKGNRLKRKTFSFSLDLQQEIVEKTCEVYDQQAIRRFSGRGFPSSVPIFIVGMPRSGSTLVEQILAAHPDVHGGGELQLFGDTVANYLHIKSVCETIPPDICLEESDFSELGKRYVEQVQLHAPSAVKITDKMLGNYMHLGLISLILPKAKIVHCRRDPIDTCLSIYKKLFARGHQYAYDLEELGEFYLLYLRMMHHWKKVLAGRFFDLCYEDLVRDQEGKTRELVQFCDLEWREECLQFNNSVRPVHTASAVQVRRPITSSSVGLWKHYEQELQPLISILQPCYGKEVT